MARIALLSVTPVIATVEPPPPVYGICNVFNETLIVLFVSVSVPASVANVPVDVGNVIVAAPPFVKMLEIVGVVSVLFVSVSAPSLVARVPEDGSVTFVEAVSVNVTSYAPEVVTLPPSVIVFPVFATPVPPYAPVITAPFHVLFVNVCVDDVSARVTVPDGNVAVVAAVVVN